MRPHEQTAKKNTGEPHNSGLKKPKTKCRLPCLALCKHSTLPGEAKGVVPGVDDSGCLSGSLGAVLCSHRGVQTAFVLVHLPVVCSSGIKSVCWNVVRFDV